MYDPLKSNISASALRQFLATPSTASVTSVPGIGKKSAEILKDEGIINIEDLLQQKKMIRDFFQYLRLKLKGVNRHRIFYALDEYETDIENDNLLGENSDPALIEDLRQAEKKCVIS